MKCIHLILQFEGSVGHQYIRFNVGVLTPREIELVTQLNSIIDELGKEKEEVTKELKTYQLQNRYQDSSWKILGHEKFTLKEASRRAKNLSNQPIAFGMIRVVDLATGIVVATYSAGGRKITRADYDEPKYCSSCGIELGPEKHKPECPRGPNIALESLEYRIEKEKELEERREKMRQMGQKLTQVIKDMANDQ